MPHNSYKDVLEVVVEGRVLESNWVSDGCPSLEAGPGQSSVHLFTLLFPMNYYHPSLSSVPINQIQFASRVAKLCRVVCYINLLREQFLQPVPVTL